MTDEIKVETEKAGAYQPKLLPILKWPDDERLHQKSVDVTVFDEELEHLALDLLHTMKTANGVGLAAPQTGNMLNIITIWIEAEKPLGLVNPVIVETSEELFEFNEGCLSVPGYFEDRKRPAKIVVKFVDVKGEPHEFECNGLYAFAIQHEIDHLNGRVFVDGASPLKRARIKSKIRKTLRHK
jgi:peptide deformylase